MHIFRAEVVVSWLMHVCGITVKGGGMRLAPGKSVDRT